MQGEIGKPVNCPDCLGAKRVGKRKCQACAGDGRVEYQESLGEVRAPVGSWLPTRHRGRSGFLVCIFGAQGVQRVNR